MKTTTQKTFVIITNTSLVIQKKAESISEAIKLALSDGYKPVKVRQIESK